MLEDEGGVVEIRATMQQSIFYERLCLQSAFPVSLLYSVLIVVGGCCSISLVLSNNRGHLIVVWSEVI